MNMGRKKTSSQLGLTLLVVGILFLGYGFVSVSDETESGLTTELAGTPETTDLGVVSRQSCWVKTVYDGDTFACDLNGNGKLDKPQEQVRLLGIDTPEMHYSRKNKTHGTKDEQDEPYAKEASKALNDLVKGKMVHLEFDVKEHDRHGRTLAYVFLGPRISTSVNEALLEKGVAEVLVIKPNQKYAEHYREIESQARRDGKGLWSGN